MFMIRSRMAGRVEGGQRATSKKFFKSIAYDRVSGGAVETGYRLSALIKPNQNADPRVYQSYPWMLEEDTSYERDCPLCIDFVIRARAVMVVDCYLWSSGWLEMDQGIAFAS
jgi:hypothetical protein